MLDSLLAYESVKQHHISSFKGQAGSLQQARVNVPLRALVAGLQKAACLFWEAPINHWAEL